MKIGILSSCCVVTLTVFFPAACTVTDAVMMMVNASINRQISGLIEKLLLLLFFMFLPFLQALYTSITVPAAVPMKV